METPQSSPTSSLTLIYYVRVTHPQMLHKSFPGGSAGKKIRLQCGRPGFDLWVGKIPWRRERLPTSVFWPEEFRELYSPKGHKEFTTVIVTSGIYRVTIIILRRVQRRKRCKPHPEEFPQFSPSLPNLRLK